MSLKGGQELTDFGSSSVVVQDQAPHEAVNRSGPDGAAQRQGYERLDRFESSDRIIAEGGQSGQIGRVLHRLLQGEGLMAAVHAS